MPASPDNAASYEDTNAAETNRLPLCVDLDGTLIKSDTLLDALCTVARVQTSALLHLPGWLLRGKAAVKYELLTRARLDAAQLPYNEALVVYLREQAALVRPLYLTTGADQSLAIHVAQHLGIFTGVLASDGATNLTGSRKLERIRSEFAGVAFAYIGNSRADLPLLHAAAQPMLANPTLTLTATLPAQKLAIARVFRDRAPLRKTLRRTVRAHQWAKNVLVFLPLLLAHNLGPAKLLAALLAFFSFSLTASSTYILNDLLDLSSDRAHPTKRRRPLAAGDMPVLAAMALGLALFAGGHRAGAAAACVLSRLAAHLLRRDAGLFALLQARRHRRCHYSVGALRPAHSGRRGGDRCGRLRLDGRVRHLLLLQPGPGQAL